VLTSVPAFQVAQVSCSQGWISPAFVLGACHVDCISWIILKYPELAGNSALHQLHALSSVMKHV
jgi:hypothetical protein